MSRPNSPLAIAFALTLIAGSALTASDEAEKRYRVCMTMVEQDGNAAFDEANTWLDEGGGPLARHCLALALIKMQKPEVAAAMLDTLAADLTAERPELVPDIHAQAAQAWFDFGDPTKAEADLAKAIEARPRDVELLIDRAVMRADRKQYWQALDDLNAALGIDPRNITAMIYRGAAYRSLESFDLARQDLDNAVQLAPKDPAARLERGILKAALKDRDGARLDWIKILQIAPDSPEAGAARARLETLDVK